MPTRGAGVVTYDATDYLISSQRRTVVHVCDKAEHLLGYTSPVGYRDAMRIVEAWWTFARPGETPYVPSSVGGLVSSAVGREPAEVA